MQEPVEPVTKIHPAYVNADRTSYYRKMVLDEVGYLTNKQTTGDQFIIDLFHWNELVFSFPLFFPSPFVLS